MDRDTLVYIGKRLWAFYYPVIALLWVFGPLSFAWFLILCLVGAFVSGTVWGIMRGDHKRHRQQLPPPATWQAPPSQWPPQTSGSNYPPSSIIETTGSPPPPGEQQ